ncbi:MAG: hypothetical protein ACHQUB_02925 [Candidatus Saccharimonadia bacterium]
MERKEKTFRYDKLVRDGIVPGMLKANNKVRYKKLNEQDFTKALVAKLEEEVKEFAPGDKTQMAEDLADIVEVIEALRLATGVSEVELNKARVSKLAKHGGYNDRIYIENVTKPFDDPWIEHLLKEPDRYPELD